MRLLIVGATLSILVFVWICAFSPIHAREHVFRIEHSGKFNKDARECCGSMGIAFDGLIFRTVDGDKHIVDDNDKWPAVAGEANADIEWFGEWQHHHAAWGAEKMINVSFSWTSDGGWEFKDRPPGALEYAFDDKDEFVEVTPQYNKFHNNGIFNIIIDGEFITEVDEFTEEANAGPGFRGPTVDLAEILSVEPADKLATTWAELKRQRR